MKIKRVSTYFVRPRWGFVEIETDNGITGWGEAVLEGHAAAVLAAINEMRDYLIGADPSEIEGIWSTLYRAGFYRGGGVLMSAISGIDQALWDIKGKVFGAPVYELIGGRCRNKMKVYSWIGGDRPSDVGQAADDFRKSVGVGDFHRPSSVAVLHHRFHLSVHGRIYAAYFTEGQNARRGKGQRGVFLGKNGGKLEICIGAAVRLRGVAKRTEKGVDCAVWHKHVGQKNAKTEGKTSRKFHADNQGVSF